MTLSIIILAVRPCAADITIEDGGFEISVGFGDSFSSTSRENFKVTGTASDAKEAVKIANEKTLERRGEFRNALDRMIGKRFDRTPVWVERPIFIERPHYPVLPPPTLYIPPPPPRPPLTLPGPLPPGVFLDSWITPGIRFRDIFGRKWYWDPVCRDWLPI